MSTSSLAIAREQASSAAPPPAPEPTPSPPPQKARAQEPLWLQRLLRLFATIGLGFINPIVRLCRGENPQQQWRE